MTTWNENVVTEFRESKGTTNYWGPKLILMHAVGAKSGEDRLTPVVGFRNDAGWMVVASKGGAPEHPAWFHNLSTHPSFDIEAVIDGEIERVPVTASLIGPDEYEAAWQAVIDEAPSFAEYPKTSGDRTIPIFQLTTTR